MFIAAWCTIAKMWKQPKFPSIHKWLKKMWQAHTHTTTLLSHKKEWNLAIATWMDLDSIMLCEISFSKRGFNSIVRTKHGTTHWFQIGKGCMLSLCLFNLNAEYIMWNAELDEAQAGIKIARRNINNLRYADDTTLTAESKEELKNLLMKVKEESEKLA